MSKNSRHPTSHITEEGEASTVANSQGIINQDGSPAEPPATQKKPSKPKSLLSFADWLKQKKNKNS